jgi:hypothetical protein
MRDLTTHVTEAPLPPDYPIWLEEDPGSAPPIDSALGKNLREILDSEPVCMQRDLLHRVGSEIREIPILWKRLPGPALRAIFPVDAPSIEDGAVAALVTLYDLAGRRTLYAHPMHAGPGVNPLLAHLDGPMSQPKAQSGADGDMATRRMVEHKKALWERFLWEREEVGHPEAGRRWKNGYYWALRRLYFCARCSWCDWGSPLFGREDPEGPTEQGHQPQVTFPDPGLTEADSQVVSKVLSSAPWRIEAAYARRGDFTALETPGILKRGAEGHVFLVFPMSLQLLQGGTLVAIAAICHEPTGKVLHAHCLSAGPETEILFRCGASALGLPKPKDDHEWGSALEEYMVWRRKAWTEFWLDDLERGGAAASQRWLEGFWQALGRLLA